VKLQKIITLSAAATLAIVLSRFAIAQQTDSSVGAQTGSQRGGGATNPASAGQGGDDTTLAYAIEGIRDYGLNVDGKELVSEADQRLAIAALKAQEAFVKVDDHGNVTSIAYHHETSSSTRERKSNS